LGRRIGELARLSCATLPVAVLKYLCVSWAWKQRRLLSAAAGLVTTLIFSSCGEPAKKTVPPSAPEPVAAKSPAPVLPDAVRKLFGRWMRADGGYVLELRGGDISGVLDAGYFNPKPIRVSRAVWMQGGEGLQVAVELNDVGYPGATYVLKYDVPTDRLVGQYTQPQMQQTFDIEFVRQAR
jgi:hypothetical protein